MQTIEFFNRALQYEQDNNLIEAFYNYKKVLEIEHDHIPSIINSSIILSKLNRVDEAIRLLHEAATISNDYLIHYNLGNFYYKNKNYKDAIISLQQARKIKPDFYNISLLMGLSFSHLNNRRGAEQCFSEVLNYDPQNRISLTALTLYYSEIDETDKALECLKKIKEEDLTVQLISLRRDLLYKLGEMSELAEHIKEESKTNPAFSSYDEFISEIPESYFTDKFGSINDKIEKLEKEIKLEPTAIDKQLSLSLCHLFRGDTDKAIQSLLQLRNPTI